MTESSEQSGNRSEPAKTAESQEGTVNQDGGTQHAISAKEQEKASQEWKRLNGLASSLPKISNYSTAKRIAVGLLGPSVRIWRYSNVITIGYQNGETKYVLGEAKEYTDALRLVAFTLANAAAKAKGKVNDQEGERRISGEERIGAKESEQGSGVKEGSNKET